MNKRIKYLLTFLFISIFLTACGSATVKETKPKSGVTSIIVTSHGAPGPWRKTQFLEIKNNLSTHFSVIGRTSKIFEEKKGTITQEQFDHLVKPLAATNLTAIKSSDKKPPYIIGGGGSSVTIKTDKGEYSYNNDYQKKYPSVISELFKKIWKLKP